VRQITDSIRIFGFNVPILIDREGRVIAGHGRLLAASELGMTAVPTLCLEHLSQGQARAFMIADNRLTEIATWDDQLLAEQLKDLSLQGLDFSLEITGFEMGEIDLRIDSLDKTPPQSDDSADAAPEVPIGPAVSKPGDLWLMDQHRLLCGDVLDVVAWHFAPCSATSARRWCSPTRPTMCRSTVMPPGSARSITAPLPWPRAR